jgi:hypothetical protein
MSKRYLLAIVCAAFMLSAGTAFADEGTGDESSGSMGTSEMGSGGPGAEKRPISLGLLLGYGVYLGDGDVNPYGVGLGVRGGYTLDMGLYLGAQFVYFLGESESAAGMETSFNVMTLALEGGYYIGVGPVIIRPSLLLGLGITSFSMSGGPIAGMDVDDSSNDFLLGPGASVIYPIDMFFIGGDLRFDIIMADETETGMTIMVNGGVNL